MTAQRSARQPSALFLHGGTQSAVIQELRHHNLAIQEISTQAEARDLRELAQSAGFVLVDESSLESDCSIHLPTAKLLKHLEGKTVVFTVDGSNVDIVNRLKRLRPDAIVLARRELSAERLEEFKVTSTSKLRTQERSDAPARMDNSLVNTLFRCSRASHTHGSPWASIAGIDRASLWFRVNPSLNLLEGGAVESALEAVDADMIGFVVCDLHGTLSQLRSYSRHTPNIRMATRIKSALSEWNHDRLMSIGGNWNGQSDPRISGIVNAGSRVFSQINASPFSSIVFVEVRLPQCGQWKSMKAHGVLGCLTAEPQRHFHGADEWFVREWMTGVELQLQSTVDMLSEELLQSDAVAWFLGFERLLEICDAVGLSVPTDFCNMALEIATRQLLIAARELRTFSDRRLSEILEVELICRCLNRAATLLPMESKALKRQMVFVSCFLRRCGSWDRREPMTLADFAAAGVQKGSEFCSVAARTWPEEFQIDNVDAQVEEDLEEDVSVIMEPEERRFSVTVPKSLFGFEPQCGDGIKVQMWSAFNYWYGVSKIKRHGRKPKWTVKDRDEFIAGLNKFKEELKATEASTTDNHHD